MPDYFLAANKEVVKQFQANKNFADRRDKVISARTYFYEDEHKCDAHLETFLKCIDAVGKTDYKFYFFYCNNSFKLPQLMFPFKLACILFTIKFTLSK